MENLLKNQKSLMISSLGKENNPEISYAPFVMLENKIYIYLSKAANHYYNLKDNKKCSVMIIEDESKCNTIFARVRVSFTCEANIIDAISDDIFDKFDEVHDAKMMSMFKKMDFRMFELDIKNGRLVKGFGQAYDISFSDGKLELNHVTGIKNQNAHGISSDKIKEMMKHK